MLNIKDRFSYRSLRLQAALMGSQFKVKVKMDPQAKTASVVWNPKKPNEIKYIILPALSHSGSQEDYDLLVGLFHHEVGHCRFSDFNVIQDVAKQMGPLGQALHNSIEDIYEEGKMCNVFHGCKKTLRNTEEIFIKRNMYKHNEPMDPVNALNLGINSMLRMSILNHPSKEVFDAIFPQMVGHFGQELTDKVLEIAKKTAFARSTADTAKITAAIIDLVKDSIKTSQGNQQQSGSQGQQSGSQGQQSGSQGQQSGSQGQQDPVKNLSKEQIDALQSVLDAKTDQIKDISKDAIAVNALEQNGALSKKGGQQDGGGAGVAHDVSITKGIIDPAWRSSASASSQPLFARLGTKLESLLESIKDANEWAGTSGRRITKNAEEKLSSGNFNIFRRRMETESVNTAVSILIDFSVSMDASFDGTSRMNAAWDTCFAIGKVMYQHDIPFSITGFAGDICHLKGFDDGLNSIKQPSGNNYATMTHEGILAAGYPLLCRNEEKKILIIITDGLPSSSEIAAINIRDVMRQGLNVAVVFINADQNTSKFATDLVNAGCVYSAATTCDELSHAVFSAVKQSIHA